MNVITASPALIAHQRALRQCTLCPHMIRPVITGEPVLSPILSIGQAPGIHEAKVMRPFGWTVYMAAVCRCFPGKQPKGGDRMPSTDEVLQCSHWLQAELQLLQPQLIILVGKLAIAQFLNAKKLDEVVGQCHRQLIQGREVDLLPLPHPSGLSTWFRTEPGRTLLQDALQTLAAHPTWVRVFSDAPN